MKPTKSFAEHALPLGLAGHQLSALDWLRPRPVAVLADPTGSGKTAVAAAALALAFDAEGARQGLWVTEAHLVGQAVRELRRFLPALQVRSWPGREEDDVRVVSVETLARHEAAVRRFAADVAVVDDASVKGVGPEPEAVARVLAGASRRLALNATPLELDATEPYRLLRLLGAPDLPDEELFHSYMEWEELPFGDERPYVTRPEAVPVVRELFSRYILRRDPHELGLVLPGLREELVSASLTAPQETAYRRAARERSPLAQSSKREKACAYALGRSAKAEAAVRRLQADSALRKVVVYAERLAHLDIMERLLDAAGIGWVRIDGPRSRAQRAAALHDFQHDPDVRVLLGTKVLERGLDGLQHCPTLFSLGATFNPAREAQRIGRLRRPGSPHAFVRHVTFTSDTDHERAKHHTLRRRALEAVTLIHGLTGQQFQEEPKMDLSRDQVEELRVSRPWLRKRDQVYGRSLEQVVSDASEGEFLADAVDTGHVPEFEGIKLALDATRQMMESAATTYVGDGRSDWAASALYGTADEFRAIAGRLLKDAEDLETLGSDLGVPTAALA